MFRKQQLCDIEARIEALETSLPSEFHNYATREQLDIFGAKLIRLTEAVSDGIAHNERHEKRINATLARARKELKSKGFEAPGLEAEAAELRDSNGTGSEEQGVPAVRDALAEVASEASSVRGVPLETLKRYRGLL